ncbi:hypothetical protein N781_14725 [Pontibacillus halophilus JSM 076056 = DSM 19796]|uniref:Uncharacterized protein n=1 Tax=Pontibacillus halophilus JSM 076056 = DSM 19796 TaxID=1385510 RepID=A0A0A5GL90_9BACI|nr:hypothetical protein N781_14725 [Pontibacillus halophilus JSM 076056 = DSM 19796]
MGIEKAVICWDDCFLVVVLESGFAYAIVAKQASAFCV